MNPTQPDRSRPVTHAAFLRAINVGKRRVKMATLRSVVESLGFTDVSTVLASGNVIFTVPDAEPVADMRRRFDAGVSDALGFEVISAIRTGTELDAIVAFDPFTEFDRHDDDVVHLGFLLDDPDDEAAARIATLSGADDRLVLRGTVLYWRRRGSLLDAGFTTKQLDRALGVAMTARRRDTVASVAERTAAS